MTFAYVDFSDHKLEIKLHLPPPKLDRYKASACNAGELVQSLGREDPLEKEMSTHSSTLAWGVPWTEELGGL